MNGSKVRKKARAIKCDFCNLKSISTPPYGPTGDKLETLSTVWNSLWIGTGYR